MSETRKGGGGSKRKEYSAPALEKGLDIVEALAKEPEGLTSAEISSRLGRPMGQLFRMLVVLQQRGYVAHQAESERFIDGTVEAYPDGSNPEGVAVDAAGNVYGAVVSDGGAMVRSVKQ